MRVYFHGDDAGSTRAITRRILLGWKLGWLDGFSVFANSDHLDDLHHDLETEPERALRLGVHLNLTEGPALVESSLADSRGRLRSTFHSLVWRRPSEEEVLREWRAQIETVARALAPRPISVLDSHNHVHMLPWLFPLVCRLARELGIPEVRLVREPFYLCRECLNVRFLANTLKWGVLALCRPRAEAALGQFGMGAPEGTVGVLFSGLMTSLGIRGGVACARRRGLATVEVITHVGRAERSELARWEGSPSAFYVSPMRDREWEGLGQVRSQPQPIEAQ